MQYILVRVVAHFDAVISRSVAKMRSEWPYLQQEAGVLARGSPPPFSIMLLP